jgi:subtilisin family serine protease
MATKKARRARNGAGGANGNSNGAQVSTNPDDLLLATLQEGGDSKTTGRFLVTFKEGAGDAAVEHLESFHGFRTANARDFKSSAIALEETGDADAVVFPEIGVALVGSQAAASRSLSPEASIEEDSPVQSIDPEYFMFATAVNTADYMRGVLRMAQMISADLGVGGTGPEAVEEIEVGPEVLGATPGLILSRVPLSTRDANGIKVAVLDTGFDLGHPEFVGRNPTTQTFVGQPVQDLHGHGTHTAGTACGPKSPAGAIPRYGIGFRSQMFIGKVLTNSGSGTQAQVLAGMNWAIANKCAVISMSLGAQIPVQPSYTAAGASALANGCLIIAASGNASMRPGLIAPAGAPANSPTIMSVAALDINLRPAVFSNGGKVDIAALGVDVFSSWPRPTLHKTISGTSMATPHVAGCAALWAQTSSTLRGVALRAKLQATARHLPFPVTDVGAGLVQAPPF